MAEKKDNAARLGELRKRIDALDDQLIGLISERGEIAREIGLVKADDGTPVYSPDREKAVLKRIADANRGPFPDSVFRAVYRELMSGSLSLEKPLRIAFLGPRGSYSHLAATGKFGASVEYEPVSDIRAAFSEVERGHADFALVPVENSIGGSVIDTWAATRHRWRGEYNADGLIPAAYEVKSPLSLSDRPKSSTRSAVQCA